MELKLRTILIIIAVFAILGTVFTILLVSNSLEGFTAVSSSTAATCPKHPEYPEILNQPILDPFDYSKQEKENLQKIYEHSEKFDPQPFDGDFS